LVAAWFCCRYCGNRIWLKGMHVDHVQPVKRGGDNWGNLVASCANCNLTKGTKLWEPRPLKWWQRVLDIALLLLIDQGSIEDGIKEKLGL
jgi:5-methylcytosine-specific restriction endonuclease McrA